MQNFVFFFFWTKPVAYGPSNEIESNFATKFESIKYQQKKKMNNYERYSFFSFFFFLGKQRNELNCIWMDKCYLFTKHWTGHTFNEIKEETLFFLKFSNAISIFEVVQLDIKMDRKFVNKIYVLFDQIIINL